jgi:hypothetical protein
MTILLPYFSPNGEPLSSDRVPGGVERFCQLVHLGLPDVVPVMYTTEDRKKRRVTKKIIEAAEEHKADVIFTNFSNETETLRVQLAGVPMVWLEHSCAGGISSIARVQHMHAFRERGGVLGMVSDFQFNTWDAFSNRIVKAPLQIDGKVNSAFATGSEYVRVAEYEAATIGRAFPTKNPFWLHQKLDGSGLTSRVITDSWDNPAGKQADYVKANSNWKEPQLTHVGLTHDNVMLCMSRAGTYVSTCVGESWGIAAFEALSHGLPLVLLTGSTLTHATQEMLDNPSDATLVRPQIKSEDFIDIVNRNLKAPFSERQDRAGRTAHKHSFTNWRTSIENLLNKAVGL